jgi:hypothetical protein
MLPQWQRCFSQQAVAIVGVNQGTSGLQKAWYRSQKKCRFFGTLVLVMLNLRLFVVPRTLAPPQESNGLAENFNKVLFAHVRCLLDHAGMDQVL